MAVLTSVILLLTLLGFFFKTDAVVGMQWILVKWAVMIAAFAIALGFINVLAVHIGKLTARKPGWFYSLVLILSAVVVLAIGLGESIFRPEEGLWGPLLAPIFSRIIAPLQAATVALLLFILTYAAYRMLRLSRRSGTVIFLVSAIVILIAQVPIPGLGMGLQDLRDVWLSWLAIPGLRALLIGVALGIAMTALRLLMGIDRPHA